MQLDDLRKDIDNIDNKIAQLFKQRLDCVKKIAEIKKENSINIYDEKRESEILSRICSSSNENGGLFKELFCAIINISKNYQEDIIKKKK